MQIVGFTNRMKFLFKRPQGRPVVNDRRSFLKKKRIHADEMWVYDYRETVCPNKFRAYVPVISIEIHCKKCNHFMDIELEEVRNL